MNVPLRALLEDQTGLPVILHNDAHAAALGEWYFGSGQGCQDFVYVTVSTGIGGGIIANGQLLLGRKGLAGEIGHMQIQSDGPVCSCGQTGCWESLASGTALARLEAGKVVPQPRLESAFERVSDHFHSAGPRYKSENELAKEYTTSAVSLTCARR